MSAPRVLILGAGFGGLQAAHELDPLAAGGQLEVTLIDGAPSFQMGFAMQWALQGRRSPQAGRRAYPPPAMGHVRFVAAHAHAIDVEGRQVLTDRGAFPFDRLVLSTGAELTADHVEGLAQGAHNLYAMEGAMRLRDELASLKGGRVLVVISATPYKCPPAPFEYALLIEEMLRLQRVRPACEVTVTSPEPQPMKVAGPEVGQAVLEILESRGIGFLPNHRLARVDPKGKRVHFEGGDSLEYAVLAAVPKHRAPPVVRDAGLADSSGFVPVELGTFQTAHEGVYAIGDVAAIHLPDGSPHPKAGIFAELQGAAVARAIEASVRGGKVAPYMGHGVCFIDLGGGQAALADANLLAPGGPRFRLDPPGPGALEAKEQFERERLARWFGPG